MPTKVKFLIDKLGDGVFAFFPEIRDNNNSYTMFTSYARIGQHSACHIDYANGCKEADFNQYCFDLLPELIGQGYKDLQVMNSQTRECHRQPTEYELKFGEGATHYRDFKLGDILTKQGKIKKWFVAPDDKLRYYTS